jgi:hypothetical protein
MSEQSYPHLWGWADVLEQALAITEQEVELFERQHVPAENNGIIMEYGPEERCIMVYLFRLSGQEIKELSRSPLLLDSGSRLSHRCPCSGIRVCSLPRTEATHP